jgi:uncharacterized membrane protein HdeD (DUF308 family)
MTSTDALNPYQPISGSLLRSLAKNWWLLLLRGIAAIMFGTLAFFWPGMTLLTLTILWGAYALSDGVFAVATAIWDTDAEASSRWWLGLVGVAGIMAGTLTFFWPGITAIVLLTFIAIWAMIIGGLQIWGAIELRKEIEHEWLLGLSGLLSMAFGLFVLIQPGAGAISVVWIIGWFAIAAGCTYIGLAFRLKAYK